VKLMLICFLILVLIIFIFLLPLRFKFHYIKKDKDDYISITWQLIPGIWGITIEIPFIKISPTSLWPILKIITQFEGEKGKPLLEQEKSIVLDKFMIKKLIKKISVVIRRTDDLKNLGKWFMSKITLLEFSWYTEIGTDEAGKTGILVGVIWALKTWVYGFLHSMANKVKTVPRISVLPNFQQEKAFCNMVCIFNISCGHIIIGGFKALYILFLIKKGGDKV
jgi:hypothetical protein